MQKVMLLLSWLVLIPFTSSFLCWQCERFGKWIPKWIALIAVSVIFLYLFLIWRYEFGITVQESSQWKIEYLIPWISSVGINIHFALDNLSLIMIALTELLGILAILCSWSEIKRYQGLFYFNLLWIIGSVFGLFMALDMFLFFFFWEMMLVPMYFLITLWGHKASESKKSITSANKFFIYTQLSGMVMLISIISLVIMHYNATLMLTFDYKDLLHTPMSESIEYLLMLGFFFAFAVKMPIVPLHGWLPDVHSQAPTAGSVDLSGILVKTAAYGMLRFSLPFFPYASRQFAPLAMWLGVISIFYSSWMAFSQNDIKRLIAYASISHMGFVLIAIYSGNQLSYYGAIIQIIANSLSTAGMFIICGQLYERLYTRDIRNMGGLWKRMTCIPVFSLFFTVSMLGIPGTCNFVGEIIILLGTFPVAPVITMTATFGLILASIYLLFMMQNIYYGPAKYTHALQSITLREKMISMILLFFTVLFGIFPQIIIDISATAIKNILY